VSKRTTDECPGLWPIVSDAFAPLSAPVMGSD
jgi:hypothetical protein